jgi:NADH:ubiquinone reductase (H+-translocating)
MNAMLAEPAEKLAVADAPPTDETRARNRIVIIGGGFAGIAAARALRRCHAEVVLIDRRNHHIFQPLLYQVATAVLAPADVAAPIRQIEEKQKNLTVMLAEVTSVDLNSRSVNVSYPTSGTHKVTFDFLIIAAGIQSSYFGHDEFARYAPALKNLNDAKTIRTKIPERLRASGAYRRRRRTLSIVDFRAGWGRPHRRGAGSLDGADG